MASAFLYSKLPFGAAPFVPSTNALYEMLLDDREVAPYLYPRVVQATYHFFRVQIRLLGYLVNALTQVSPCANLPTSTKPAIEVITTSGSRLHH
jgi:hypothetical protein